MPFDGKSFAQPDVMSVESLTAWLGTKDPGETYCYADHGHCLMGQYCKHHGIDYWVASTWGDLPENRMEEIACIKPHTFGAALDRARRYLTTGNV